jgi:hypothetical protein
VLAVRTGELKAIHHEREVLHGARVFTDEMSKRRAIFSAVDVCRLTSTHLIRSIWAAMTQKTSRCFRCSDSAQSCLFRLG